jgi:hypothetical protein
MEVYKAQIAQLVEQRIENPCVPGSIPGLGTITPVNKALSATFPPFIDSQKKYTVMHSVILCINHGKK